MQFSAEAMVNLSRWVNGVPASVKKTDSERARPSGSLALEECGVWMGHMQMENPVVAAGHANRTMFRSVQARKRLYEPRPS